MRRCTASLSVAILLFIAVRVAGSGATGTALPTLVSLLSVLLPALFLFFFMPRGERTPSLAFPLRGLPLFLLLPPFLLSVLGLAYVSALLANLLNLNRTEELTGSLPVLLLSAVLVPALTEEFLVRFLCLRQMALFDRSAAVWVSAVVFAALHMNLAQIPYAFFAGLVLAALALASDSIWVPVLFHLLNNLLSVLLSVCPGALLPSLLVLAGLTALLPLLLVLLRRRQSVSLPFLAFGRCLLLPAPARRVVLGLLASPILIPVLFCLVMAVL